MNVTHSTPFSASPVVTVEVTLVVTDVVTVDVCEVESVVPVVVAVVLCDVVAVLVTVDVPLSDCVEVAVVV